MSDSAYLAGDGFGRALHLATDFLSGLLEVLGLSNLALHLRGSGALGRTSLLLGGLRDDAAGRCVGHALLLGGYLALLGGVGLREAMLGGRALCS